MYGKQTGKIQQSMHLKGELIAAGNSVLPKQNEKKEEWSLNYLKSEVVATP